MHGSGPGRWRGAALAVALSAPAVHAAGFEVRHDPLTCVPLDRYARVSASAPEAASAELQFRVDPGAGWYSIGMKAEGEEWVAVLPRPTRPLERFEYRIVMADRERRTVATPALAVQVSEPGGECLASGQPSVSSSIVVRVPAGAPLVPPVPAGFSPTGTVAAQEIEPPRRRGRSREVLIGLGLAGGIGAGVALGASGEPATPARDIPTFTFIGTAPVPDSVVSVSRTTFQVAVEMDHEPANPLTFDWRLELRPGSEGPPCLVMASLFIDAQRPRFLILSAPLTSFSACGDRYTVDTGRLTIRVGDRLVLDVTRSLRYRVEP